MADGSGSSAPAPAEAFDLRAVNYRYDSNNAVGLYLYLAALVFCGWHLYERWSIEKRLAQRLSALERELGVRRRMLRLSLYLFISLLTRSVWFWLRESGIFDDSCKTDIECPWTVLLALDKFSVLIQFFAFTVLVRYWSQWAALRVTESEADIEVQARQDRARKEEVLWGVTSVWLTLAQFAFIFIRVVIDIETDERAPIESQAVRTFFTVYAASVSVLFLLLCYFLFKNGRTLAESLKLVMKLQEQYEAKEAESKSSRKARRRMHIQLPKSLEGALRRMPKLPGRKRGIRHSVSRRQDNPNPSRRLERSDSTLGVSDDRPRQSSSASSKQRARAPSEATLSVKDLELSVIERELKHNARHEDEDTESVDSSTSGSSRTMKALASAVRRIYVVQVVCILALSFRSVLTFTYWVFLDRALDASADSVLNPHFFFTIPELVVTVIVLVSTLPPPRVTCLCLPEWCTCGVSSALRLALVDEELELQRNGHWELQTGRREDASEPELVRMAAARAAAALRERAGGAADSRPGEPKWTGSPMRMLGGSASVAVDVPPPPSPAFSAEAVDPGGDYYRCNAPLGQGYAAGNLPDPDDLPTNAEAFTMESANMLREACIEADAAAISSEDEDAEDGGVGAGDRPTTGVSGMLAAAERKKLQGAVDGHSG